jgi:hypothetical protein
MKRFVTRALIVVAATVGIVFAQVAPASATVHEIVGQWCSLEASGKEPLGPPGISNPARKNFAKPLNASGFVTGDVVEFRDGFLVEFNYANPNAKVIGTDVFVVIGEVAPGQPLYLELITPDPSFPAFKHCPKLATA